MSGSATNGTSVADLDRRVLGAGTTLRFVLLVVLVGVSSIQLILIGVPHTVRDGVSNPAATCTLAVGGDPGDQGLIAAYRTVALTNTPGYRDCVQRYETVASLPWVTGGLAAVFTLAFVIYWSLPRWKTRRGRLVAVRDPELAEELARWHGTPGWKRHPTSI
ncbi:MAG TPA: hypothetical protein VE465_16585 [Streptosporangiaceae bacterium]|jgi:hypothetical protein|nr:hypothetical protein [Streptosporangiaceae bacterium]